MSLINFQLIGPRVMTRLFELIVRPLATPFTQGAFLNGLRLMAVDGTVFDVPDTELNAKVFGYPGTRTGTKAALRNLVKSFKKFMVGYWLIIVFVV